MHPEVLAASEFASLAAFARAVFGRAVSEGPEVRELRISVVVPREAIAGLSVVEWELIDSQGMATHGGEL